MTARNVTKIQGERVGGASAVLLALLSSCIVQPKEARIPRVEDPRPAAVIATRNSEWKLAAHYWSQTLDNSSGEDVQACVEAATALRHLQDLEGEITMLQLGLEKDPHNADLLELKGDALVKLGFRRSAEACYERCLEEEPDRIPALCSLGHLRLLLDREMAAINPLQRALDLGCPKLSTRENLARAYRESGEPILAWALYTSRIQMDPPPSAEFIADAAGLALNPILLAQCPDATAVALVWLEGSLLREPNHTEANFQHGVLSESIGNTLDAIESYGHSVKTQPTFLPALTNLALLFAELGHEGPCREMVARSVELETDYDRRIALRELLVRFE